MDSDPLLVGDISAIEDLDPSLADGATIIYDREVFPVLYFCYSN